MTLTNFVSHMSQLLQLFARIVTPIIFFKVITALLARVKKWTPTESPSPSSFIRCRLTTFARLSQLSYCESQYHQDNISGKDIVIPVGEVHGVRCQDNHSLKISVRGQVDVFESTYNLVQTYGNNSVWLFAPTDTNCTRASWIIVFRGTHVLADLISDFKLMMAVATGNDNGFRDLIDNTYSLLYDAVFCEMNITKDHSILLLGHSLGASLAEAMLLQLNKEGYHNVTACGFDSPGLPECIRSLFPSPPVDAKSKLTLVYGHDNVVNNLNPAPIGAISFRVSEDDPLKVQNIVKFLCTVPSIATTFWTIAFKSAPIGPKNSHSLQNISLHLEAGHFHRDSATSQGELTGVALRYLFSLSDLISKAGRVFGVVSATEPNISVAEVQQDHIANGLYPHDVEEPKGKYPEFPGATQAIRDCWEMDDYGGFLRPVPYAVRDMDKFANSLDKKADVVCPLIGLTSVGKTSLIKAILDLAPDDDLLPVSSTMDTTRERIVILWQKVRIDGEEYRIWLMDIPGVHGAASAAGGNSTECLSSQLHSLQFAVQAACFVVSNNPTHEARRLFREICSVLGDRVFIVYNNHLTVRVPAERIKLLEESRTAYTEDLNKVVKGEVKDLNIVLTKVYRCKGATAQDLDQEEGIDQLQERLMVWVKGRHKDIEEAREQKHIERLNEEDANYATGLTSIVGVVTTGLAVVVPATELAASGSFWIAGASALGPIGLAIGVTIGAGLGLHAMAESRARKRESERQ